LREPLLLINPIESLFDFLADLYKSAPCSQVCCALYFHSDYSF
jgi:hypothetical protein